MVWKPRQPMGYQKGKAKKFQKSKTYSKKRDQKSYVYSRKYPLSTRIIGAKRDVLQPRSLDGFKQTKRKYLKMLIRKFPKYFLSTGAKSYDFDFSVRPLYAEAILLIELPSPFEFIVNPNCQDLFGIPPLTEANGILKRIRSCEYIMESELIQYKELYIGKGSARRDNEDVIFGDDYLNSINAYAREIGITASSVYHALAVGPQEPHLEQMLSSSGPQIQILFDDKTYKGTEFRFRWANYMKSLYLYWVHFAHMIVSEGLETQKANPLSPITPPMAAQLVAFLKSAGFASKNILASYTVSNEKAMMRTRYGDLTATGQDFIEDGKFQDERIFQMLGKVREMKTSLASFNGAWAPAVCPNASSFQFSENLVTDRQFTPSIFGGMVCYHGQNVAEHKLATGVQVTPVFKTFQPGIANTILDFSAGALTTHRNVPISTLIIKGYHSIAYRNSQGIDSSILNDSKFVSITKSASVLGISWACRTYTPKQLVQQQHQFQQSKAWYVRNDYALSSQRSSLIIRPVKITGHDNTIFPGMYAFDEQFAFIKNVGITTKYEGKRSQAVSRISLSQVLTETLDSTTKELLSKYSQLRQNFYLGAIPADVGDNNMAAPNFGITPDNQFKSMLEAQVSMNAQKYIPTTYFIDYDEDSLQTLGMNPKKLEQLLSDRCVTLTPDVAKLSVEQLKQISVLFKTMLSQADVTIQQRGPRIYTGIEQDSQLLGASFNDRLYASLQQYKESGQQSSAMYSFIMYSVLKAARYNLKFLPEETKNISLKQQLLGLARYFELLSSHNEANGSPSVVVDLSIPTYKIKYLEHVKTITVCYPQPAGIKQDDIEFCTSLTSSPFISSVMSDSNIRSSLLRYPLILNPATDGLVPCFGLIPTSLLSLHRHIYNQATTASFLHPKAKRNSEFPENVVKQFLLLTNPLAAPHSSSIDFMGCCLSAMSRISESGSVSFLPTLKISSVYRRKQVVPGMHLVSLLKRGKVVSVVTSRPMQPTSMFLYGTNGSNISGMLNEATALVSGVDNYPVRQQKNLAEFYEGFQGTLSANYSYPKVLALNLIGKQQIRMMQLMYQQSQYQVSSNTQMGLAVTAWRSFDDVFALSGITSDSQSLWLGDNQNRRGMGENPRALVVVNPIEPFSILSSFTIGMYSPLTVDLSVVPERNRTYTMSIIKSLSHTSLAPLDVYGISYHCQSFRLKRMIEQDIRKLYSVDYDTFSQMFSPNGAFSQDTNISQHLARIGLATTFLPKPERFQTLRDFVVTRNTQWLSYLLTSFEKVPLPLSSVEAAFQFVRSQVSSPNGLSMSYKKLQKTLPGFVNFQTMVGPIAKQHIVEALNKTLTVQRPDVDNKLSRQYRLMSQAAMVQSNFSKWMSAIKGQYKRHKRNPYWVDCYFGTFLSFGENTRDLVDGLNHESTDWVHMNPLADVIFPTFSTVHGQGADDEQVVVPVSFQIQYSTGQMSQTISRIAYPSLKAQLLDQLIFTTSFLGTFQREITRNKDPPLMDRLLIKYRENLDDLGFTNHAKRHAMYLAFDPSYSESHSANQDDVTNFTVSDPSCCKFTTDILLYELPLTFVKDASQQQSVIARNYAYRNPAQSEPISSLGMKDVKYNQQAMTTTVDELYQLNINSALVVKSPVSFFQSLRDPALPFPGFSIPLTILERLFFQSVSANPVATPFKLLQFCYQAKNAFHLMYKQYHTILEMYTNVGYTKIQDYDIYFVLANMQNYLQNYVSSLRSICPSRLQPEATMQSMILQSAQRNGTIHPWYVSFQDWLKKVCPQILDVGMDFDDYYPLWAQVPKYRVKSDQLLTVKKEAVDYSKASTKQQRQILNSMSRDPFKPDTKQYGYKQYVDKYQGEQFGIVPSEFVSRGSTQLQDILATWKTAFDRNVDMDDQLLRLEDDERQIQQQIDDVQQQDMRLGFRDSDMA